MLLNLIHYFLLISKAHNAANAIFFLLQVDQNDYWNRYPASSFIILLRTADSLICTTKIYLYTSPLERIRPFYKTPARKGVKLLPTTFSQDMCDESVYKTYKATRTIINTVADSGFSWRAPIPKMAVLTYCFAIFLPKLHENERIWTPRRALPWRPLGPIIN